MPTPTKTTQKQTSQSNTDLTAEVKRLTKGLDDLKTQLASMQQRTNTGMDAKLMEIIWNRIESLFHGQPSVDSELTGIVQRSLPPDGHASLAAYVREARKWKYDGGTRVNNGRLKRATAKEISSFPGDLSDPEQYRHFVFLVLTSMCECHKPPIRNYWTDAYQQWVWSAAWKHSKQQGAPPEFKTLINPREYSTRGAGDKTKGKANSFQNVDGEEAPCNNDSEDAAADDNENDADDDNNKDATADDNYEDAVDKEVDPPRPTTPRKAQVIPSSSSKRKRDDVEVTDDITESRGRSQKSAKDQPSRRSPVRSSHGTKKATSEDRPVSKKPAKKQQQDEEEAGEEETPKRRNRRK